MSIKQASDEAFDALVLAAPLPVLVDFWAAWCGPCKAIAPILEEISAEYEQRLQVVKVDVETCPATAQKFGIRSIPTLMIFKGGVVEAQFVGMLSKPQLIKLLDSKL